MIDLTCTGRVDLALHDAAIRRNVWLYSAGRDRLIARACIERDENLHRTMLDRRTASIRRLVHRFPDAVNEMRRLGMRLKSSGLAINLTKRRSFSRFILLGSQRLPVFDFVASETALPDESSKLIARCGILAPIRRRVERAMAEMEICRATPHRLARDRAGARIVGDDAPKVSCLAGIAHELGHMLAEEDWASSGTPIAWRSEAVAHLFEEEIVAEVLREVGLGSFVAKWRQQQRAIDSLNFYAFFHELHEIQTKHATFPAWFGAGWIARESVFVSPGYQSAYAAASAMRLAHRGRMKQTIWRGLEAHATESFPNALDR